jgi:hypothetical protein
MEDNPYDRYDLSLPWVPEEKQNMKGPQPKEEPAFPEESGYEYPYIGKWQEEPIQRGRQLQRDAPNPEYMPKAEGLSLLGTLKKYIIIGSILAFGFLSGLAVGHTTGMIPGQQGPSPFFHSPSPRGPFDDDHHFFHHRGGFEFGNGNLPQPPFSGSNAS